MPRHGRLHRSRRTATGGLRSQLSAETSRPDQRTRAAGPQCKAISRQPSAVSRQLNHRRDAGATQTKYFNAKESGRSSSLSVGPSGSTSWTDTAGQRSYTALRGRAEKVTIRQVRTIPECHATDTPDFSHSPMKSSVRAGVRGVTLASLAARTTAETRRNGEAETQEAGDGRPSGASTSGLSAPLGWSHFSRVKS